MNFQSFVVPRAALAGGLGTIKDYVALSGYNGFGGVFSQGGPAGGESSLGYLVIALSGRLRRKMMPARCRRDFLAGGPCGFARQNCMGGVSRGLCANVRHIAPHRLGQSEKIRPFFSFLLLTFAFALCPLSLWRCHPLSFQRKPRGPPAGVRVPRAGLGRSSPGRESRAGPSGIRECFSRLWGSRSRWRRPRNF